MKAPAFTLKLVDGREVSLDELQGDVVVLNFWATWCVPCKVELPILDAYYRARKDYGLQVFAIATEDGLTNVRRKEIFAAMAIPAVEDITGPYRPITGVPTNYIIGRSGTIRYAAPGALGLEQLNALLVPLLREPQASGAVRTSTGAP